MPSPPSQARLSSVAVALARGDSAAVIAKAEGVSARTVQRWAALPECKSEVESIRRAMLSDAVGKLQSLALKAVKTLDDLMTPGRNESTRLSAARAVLSGVVELQSHNELIGRIEEIEKRASHEPKSTY